MYLSIVCVYKVGRGRYDIHDMQPDRPLNCLPVKACLKISPLGLRSMSICLQNTDLIRSCPGLNKKI